MGTTPSGDPHRNPAGAPIAMQRIGLSVNAAGSTDSLHLCFLWVGSMASSTRKLRATTLVAQRTLHHIEVEIRELLTTGREAALSAAESARRIGQDLLEAQAHFTPNGGGLNDKAWGKWAADQFGFTGQHRQRFIDIAQRWPEIEHRLPEQISSGRWGGVFSILRDMQADERHILLAARAAQLQAKPLPLPGGRFDVIVLDPPWSHDTQWHPDYHRGAPLYPTMSLDQIAALPVAEKAERDCTLWLWTTNASLHDAFHLVAPWGFEYQTLLTWAKDRFGLGVWLRTQTEHCLLATRGHPVLTLTNQTTLLHGPMREHSRKPDEFYVFVESLCPGRKFDWFSREAREGWVNYGDELGKFGPGPSRGTINKTGAVVAAPRDGA